MRLLFVSLGLAAAFNVSAQSADSFALTPPLVSQAITSCGDVTVSGGLIDSSATAGRGNILSNGNIKVTGGKVDGDATAGPGKTVTHSGSGTITGPIASATTPFPCSIIDLAALSTTLASTNDNASIPLSAQHKNPVSSGGDFTLSGGDSLTLNAGTYYFHKFTMSGGSTITLAGPVHILTSSDVNVSGGSITGANQWQLHFWSSGTKFVVSSSTFVGFIYAPAATTTVSAGTVIGGIYGGLMTVSGNSHVTRTIDDTPPVVTIISPLDHEAVVDLSHVTVRGTVTDSETVITSLQVNGADVALTNDGSFTTTVNLSTATPPTITATATNAAGLSATSTASVQSALNQLSVAPPSLSIDQNATGQLAAIGTYADGSTADLTASATWTSSASSVATVIGGLVTAGSVGTATITATVGSFSATATITVNPLLQSITVAPATATVAIGGKQPFTATGRYSDGATLDLTSSAAWTTNDSGLASIDATGVATGLSPGTVTVRGTLGSVSGTASLTILATPTIVSLQPVRGSTNGGDTVTITGTNFGTTSTTHVMFGGTPAVVTSANATTLTVTTPVHLAGTVDITVTAPSGTVTQTGSFTYIAPPTVASIAPNRGKTSGGDNVTVTGTNFDLVATTLTIGGVAATNVVVVSATSLTAATPPGNAGTASVSVTTAGGIGTLTSGFTFVPPPTITAFSPAQGSAGTSVTINGTNFDAVATNDLVVIGGAPAAVVSANTTALVAMVPAAAATGPVVVTTSGGTAVAASNFAVVVYRSLAITSPVTSLQPGSQQQLNAIVTLFNNSTSDVTSSATWTSSNPSVASVSSAGVVTAASAGAADITATFSGLTAALHILVQSIAGLPPPTIQGPPLDPTVSPQIADSLRFLYTGPSAIQTGVTSNAIADTRVAVVSGRILDRSGAPISGAQVTAAQHPEFGQTLTRSDGRFDFAFNGGGTIHLVLAKTGYISSDREVNAYWNQQLTLDDAVLVPYDAIATAVTMNASTFQVAQGSMATDADGTRRATILFPAGVTATLLNGDGTTQAASTIHVRATEFTVGASGPSAMPAALPPTTAYTYCVELSVDEAPGVTFSRSIPLYVENFLNFPVGTPVPLGYFNRGSQQWVPATNGIVLKVLAISGGQAQLDLDGDGQADSAEQLAAAGIDAAELQTLASLYTPGQTLWRMGVDHFTPWDGNFDVGEPDDAEDPDDPDPATGKKVSHSMHCPGSNIDCENQRLGESIPITGTPYTLEYDSGRSDRTQYQTTIQVTGSSIPASLLGARVTVSIAGRTLKQDYPPASNQQMTFEWDGLDEYNRPVVGARDADITVTYLYPATYKGPAPGRASFDLPSQAQQALIDSFRIPPFKRSQSWTVELGHFSAAGTGFGGWTLSAQKAYDAVARTLYEPGATEQSTDPAGTEQVSVYRVPFTVFTGPVSSLAFLPDGTFYYVNNFTNIYYANAAGVPAQFAGAFGFNTRTGLTSDGVPALNNPITPTVVAVSRDGIVYFGEKLSGTSARIRRVVNGLLQTVAGGAVPSGGNGDGGPATAASIVSVGGMAFAPDGVLYFLDSGAGRVRRVGLDGIITTVAGGGLSLADNVPAPQANLATRLAGIAVGADGSVYFGDSGIRNSTFVTVIRRLTPDGILHIVAGSLTPTRNLQDGDAATSGGLFTLIGGLALARDGSIIIDDNVAALGDINGGGNTADYIRVVSGGVIHILASKPRPTGTAPTPITNGRYARDLSFDSMCDLQIGPDDRLYVADCSVTGTTFPVAMDLLKFDATFPALRPAGQSTFIPSSDGAEVYVFDAGRHTRTQSTLSGATHASLNYNGAGFLTSVADATGRVTTIDRDASGNPTAITAPGGEKTLLSVGSQGLASVTDPASGSYQMQYNAQGLLSQLTDPLGGIHKFTYDESGRLLKDEAPIGFTTLARAGTSENFTVTRMTAQGHSTTVGWSLNAKSQTVRPITTSDGLTLNLTENSDGVTRTFASPTGMTTTITQSADPRFGMESPFVSSATEKTPSGLTLALSSSRTVTLANSSDPLSLTSITQTTALNGRTVRAVFSKASLTSTVTSPAGRVQSFTFDSADRAVSMQVPGLNALAIGYDGRGQIASLTAGTRNVSFTHDDHQRLKTVSSPIVGTISYEYDAADRMTKETFADGRQVAFGYDAAGNLTSVMPPGRTAHTFSFTPMSLVDTYSPPIVPNATVFSTSYRYNSDEQLTSISRPDGTTLSFGYDDAGRLASITSPSASYQFAYSPLSGQLATASNSDGLSTTLAYDGRLLTSIVAGGPISSAVTFTYDTSFRPISQSINGGNAVAFAYDNDDLLTAAGTLSLRRDASSGLLTGSTLGNVVDALGYNSYGEVTSYAVNVGGSPILTMGYTRDDGGRITQKTETANGQTSTTNYSYDNTTGRLTDVTTNGVLTARYGYDVNGNRTTMQTMSGTVSATYDAQDRMTSYNGASYFYSENGDLLKKIDASGTTMYTYDALGNLRHVTLPDSTNIDYVIDAASRRVGKKVNGTLAIGWIYDDQAHIVAETDGNGTVTKRFVYGARGNAPEYMTWQGGTYRIVTDHLGSPRYILEVTGGTLAEAISYDEFGVVTSDANPGFVPFGFTAGLYDADTGFTRLGTRDYDPGTGRFTSKDPKGFSGGDTNLYGYVMGDPLNLIDPMGTDWVDTTANISAGIGDALLLGFGDELRDWSDRQFGWGGGASVDRCSGAYRVSTGVTSAAMLALGTARIGYAAGAKGIALGSGTVEEAVAARNALKVAGRFGLNQTARVYSTEQILSKYGTAEEAIAAAGRTNSGFNAAGAAAIGGAVNTLLNQPDCGCR